MDNTVIILIGAGVSCVVIGFALFVKLAKMGSQEESEASGNKKLLADDYAENFQECFENTGNIEDTLEQLADIYTGNQYMYNLIINALNFLKEDQGDYETALEGINVDSDTSIMKMHNNAIKKALNINIGNRNNAHEDAKEKPEREKARESHNKSTKSEGDSANDIVCEPGPAVSAFHEGLNSRPEFDNESSFADKLPTNEEDEYEEDEGANDIKSALKAVGAVVKGDDVKIDSENKKEKLKDSEKYKLVGADGIIKNTGRDIGAVKNEAKDKAKEILKNKKYRMTIESTERFFKWCIGADGGKMVLFVILLITKVLMIHSSAKLCSYITNTNI